MDREKVIKGFEVCTSKPCYCTDCPYKANCCLDSQEVMQDALALLKEQKEREKRICNEICAIIRGSCSTDTDDDKEFVCHEIQKRFTEGR